MQNGNLTIQMYMYLTILCHCRFESLNSRVRTFNVFSNRQAPSRDIAGHFSVLQHLRFLCHGGQMGPNERYGGSFCSLYK